MTNKFKLIWISDIHYMGENRYSGFDDKVFDLVKNTIDNIAENDDEIYNGDLYILLSGDIAFSGQKIEYQQLNKKLFSCINKTKFNKKRIKVLVCPGNHDASWINFETIFSKEVLKNNTLNTLVNIFKDKYDEASQFKFDKNKFKKIFENFSNEYAQSARENIYQDNETQSDNLKKDIFILNDETIEISNEYKTSGLEGYVVDKKNKVIFVILNTAWYSKGNSLQKFLKDVKLDDLSQDDLIRLIEVSNEYGQMVTGLCNSESGALVEEINKKFKDNPEYLKICMMHHPLEWLDWNEKESYKIDFSGRKKPDLITVLEKCDIILSGHVHPSRTSRKEYFFNGNVVHLRGPQFLSHHPKDQYSLFPCNGFVSMELNFVENDSNKVERSLNINYHDIEITTQSPIIELNREIESESVRLKDFDRVTKEFTQPAKENEKEYAGFVYRDITSKTINKLKLIKFYNLKTKIENSDIIDINISNINIICFYYLNQIFIYQKDDYWLGSDDLITVFNNLESFDIRYMKFFKSGFNISKTLGVSLEAYNDTGNLNLLLTKENDKKFNLLRTEFFNILDTLILNSTEDSKLKQIFKKAALISYSNHIVGSDFFT